MLIIYISAKLREFEAVSQEYQSSENLAYPFLYLPSFVQAVERDWSLARGGGG